MKTLSSEDKKNLAAKFSEKEGDPWDIDYQDFRLQGNIPAAMGDLMGAILCDSETVSDVENKINSTILKLEDLKRRLIISDIKGDFK